MSVVLQYLNLHRVILIYLAVPAMIFLLFWLRLVYGLCGSLLLVLAILRVWNTDKDRFHKKDYKLFFPVFVFALLLTVLSGLGGFGFQNSDHEKHNALIHDLTVLSLIHISEPTRPY